MGMIDTEWWDTNCEICGKYVNWDDSVKMGNGTKVQCRNCYKGAKDTKLDEWCKKCVFSSEEEDICSICASSFDGIQPQWFQPDVD